MENIEKVRKENKDYKQFHHPRISSNIFSMQPSYLSVRINHL